MGKALRTTIIFPRMLKQGKLVVKVGTNKIIFLLTRSMMV